MAALQKVGSRNLSKVYRPIALVAQSFDSALSRHSLRSIGKLTDKSTFCLGRTGTDEQHEFFTGKLRGVRIWSKAIDVPKQLLPRARREMARAREEARPARRSHRAV